MRWPPAACPGATGVDRPPAERAWRMPPSRPSSPSVSAPPCRHVPPPNCPTSGGAATPHVCLEPGSLAVSPQPGPRARCTKASPSVPASGRFHLSSPGRVAFEKPPIPDVVAAPVARDALLHIRAATPPAARLSKRGPEKESPRGPPAGPQLARPGAPPRHRAGRQPARGTSLARHVRVRARGSFGPRSPRTTADTTRLARTPQPPTVRSSVRPTPHSSLPPVASRPAAACPRPPTTRPRSRPSPTRPPSASSAAPTSRLTMPRRRPSTAAAEEEEPPEPARARAETTSTALPSRYPG